MLDINKEKFLKECNTRHITILYYYTLAPHTYFKTGGKAQLYYTPASIQELQTIIMLCHEYTIPINIIGGASNILVPDTILEGLTISTLGLNAIHVKDTEVSISSGMSVGKAASILANQGFRSIDFLYGMPGTIGGALWMNARCYGKEISEVLISAKGLSPEGKEWEYLYNKDDFDYKVSPFKNLGIITECTLQLSPDNPKKIWQDMLGHEQSRTKKGHYIAPCAGSVFKNNKNFGAPSGELLDKLGWRKKTYNAAMVNPYHANIIINTGGASSQDIIALSQQMADSVKESYGFELEREVVLLGDAPKWNN